MSLQSPSAEINGVTNVLCQHQMPFWVQMPGFQRFSVWLWSHLLVWMFLCLTVEGKFTILLVAEPPQQWEGENGQLDLQQNISFCSDGVNICFEAVLLVRCKGRARCPCRLLLGKVQGWRFTLAELFVGFHCGCWWRGLRAERGQCLQVLESRFCAPLSRSSVLQGLPLGGSILGLRAECS